VQVIRRLAEIEVGPRVAAPWWFLLGELSLGWHLMTGNPWPIVIAFLCLLGGLCRMGD
jgi:hypothetical protein